MNLKIPLLTLMLAFSLTGCVKRTILIESEPAGAKVWINEHPAGTTPVKYEFITHGRYNFRLRKSGFREVVAREKVPAPLYEWIPFDFFAEILLPVRLEDKHRFLYKLTPEAPSERLQEETPADVKADLEGLQDSDPEKRRAACFNLARRRDPSTAEAVLAATRDPAPIVRKTALQAFRAIRGKDSLPRLTEMLAQDPNPEVRWQAAAEIEALKGKQAIPDLIQALKDKDPLVRAGAAEALKGISPDPQAARPLILALRDKDTTVRRAAAEALGKIGDRSAVRPLIRVLFHHDFQTRRRAAASLGQIGDPSAGFALARSLDNWDPKLRQIAGQVLIQMGDRRAVPMLIRYLRSWEATTRQESAIVLGGLKDERAVEPLVRAFHREPNPVTSHAMLEALQSLGAQTDPSWEEVDRYRLQKYQERVNRQDKKEKKQQEQGSEKGVEY
ncbi:MAG: HEAT repeat domain-containing protein [Candidatus Omnitrophota bacterium]|nr:HEAT repeat domain-containing protein [Candidatus Omnitrophota bacterium]